MLSAERGCWSAVRRCDILKQLGDWVKSGVTQARLHLVTIAAGTDYKLDNEFHAGLTQTLSRSICVPASMDNPSDTSFGHSLRIDAVSCQSTLTTLQWMNKQSTSRQSALSTLVLGETLHARSDTPCTQRQLTAAAGQDQQLMQSRDRLRATYCGEDATADQARDRRI